jgi:gamma-glutamylcyclotransferase (GGCT)/AIG2-like uncharacterized protein YtfP
MEYVFVYGTLMRNVNNNMSRFLQANARFIGDAYIYGKLYEVNEYPGAIMSIDPSERVCGNIFEIRNVEAVFKALDEYEGIGAGNPTCYEYVRTQVTAYLEDHTEITTWFYVYNFSTESLKRIVSGRYL